MTLDKQIEYMKAGLEALENALLADKAMVPAQRERIIQHCRAYDEIIETLCNYRGLQK
jgi:hypothetical protein